MRRNTISLALLPAIPMAVYGFQKPLPSAIQVKQLNALLNVRSLANAMNIYSEDADGVYPNVLNLKSLKTAIQPYVKDKKFWKTENEKTEIRFNFALGGIVPKSLEHPDKVAIFYESKNWPDGRRAVSFVDGTGRLLSPHEWAEVSSSLLLKVQKSADPLPANYGAGWKD